MNAAAAPAPDVDGLWQLRPDWPGARSNGTGHAKAETRTAAQVARILSAEQNGSEGYRGICPICGKRVLRVDDGPDGLLLKCYGGCAPDAVRVGVLDLVERVERADRQFLKSITDIPSVQSQRATQIEYLEEPVAALGAVNGVTGPPGEGKSTYATACVRTANAAGRVALVLDRENGIAIVADRLDRLGVVDGPLLRWWGGWLTPEAPQPGSPLVLDWVRSQEPRPLVIVDSLAAFYDGKDENDAGAMRAFMNSCRKVADLGACVIVIHHDGKAGSARDYRGSSDFKASVDQAFHCSNTSTDGKLDIVTLRCFKSRFGFSGSLVYNYLGGRFVRDNRESAPTITGQLAELLRANPGVGQKAFEDLASKGGLGRNKARAFLDDGAVAGTVRREVAGANQYRHYLVGVK